MARVPWRLMEGELIVDGRICRPPGLKGFCLGWVSINMPHRRCCEAEDGGWNRSGRWKTEGRGFAGLLAQTSERDCVPPPGGTSRSNSISENCRRKVAVIGRRALLRLVRGTQPRSGEGPAN